MAYWVYIVRCCDNTLYTGISNDVDSRIAAHNSGTGAKYTRSRSPVTLMYSEKCEDRSAALRRELAIKKMPRKAKLALIDNSCG